MSRDHQLLCNDEQVRALLGGRMTQTRRLVRPQPPEERIVRSCPFSETSWALGDLDGNCMCREKVSCPYGAPGDLLWCRETHWLESDGTPVYRADGEFLEGWTSRGLRWHPSIHMPKSVCRLWLRVEDVRVERLQEITEEGAKAEGVHVAQRAADPAGPTLCQHCGQHRSQHVGTARACFGGTGTVYSRLTYRGGFIHLWDAVNGERAPWASNPWVWVVSFSRAEPPA